MPYEVASKISQIFPQCRHLISNISLSIVTEAPRPLDPCNPSPCGPNAECFNGECRCPAEYIGNPYEGCRPECVLNTDCSRDKACLRNKCRDPCPGTCGQGARCEVINHIPTCSCPEGLSGDPFTLCRILDTPPPAPQDPCNPTPCGPNSNCRNTENRAICSCLPEFIGTPPQCRPQCVVNSECGLTESCINKKCVNPCVGACGNNARCEVINHSPICSCNAGQTGDPFRGCYDLPAPPREEVIIEPCNPSPCGPNARCQAVGEQASCQCIENYIGAPPNCRPECVVNSDCATTQACVNNRCIDPCPGSCGTGAECHVIGHAVSCTCPTGFTGNAFVQCVVLG